MGHWFLKRKMPGADKAGTGTNKITHLHHIKSNLILQVFRFLFRLIFAGAIAFFTFYGAVAFYTVAIGDALAGILVAAPAAVVSGGCIFLTIRGANDEN